MPGRSPSGRPNRVGHFLARVEPLTGQVIVAEGKREENRSKAHELEILRHRARSEGGELGDFFVGVGFAFAERLTKPNASTSETFANEPSRHVLKKCVFTLYFRMFDHSLRWISEVPAPVSPAENPGSIPGRGTSCSCSTELWRMPRQPRSWFPWCLLQHQPAGASHGLVVSFGSGLAVTSPAPSREGFPARPRVP